MRKIICLLLLLLATIGTVSALNTTNETWISTATSEQVKPIGEYFMTKNMPLYWVVNETYWSWDILQYNSGFQKILLKKDKAGVEAVNLTIGQVSQYYISNAVYNDYYFAGKSGTTLPKLNFLLNAFFNRNLTVNGQLKTSLSGNGTAYACLDENGVLFRSYTPCI